VNQVPSDCDATAGPSVFITPEASDKIKNHIENLNTSSTYNILEKGKTKYIYCVQSFCLGEFKAVESEDDENDMTEQDQSTEDPFGGTDHQIDPATQATEENNSVPKGINHLFIIYLLLSVLRREKTFYLSETVSYNLITDIPLSAKMDTAGATLTLEATEDMDVSDTFILDESLDAELYDDADNLVYKTDGQKTTVDWKASYRKMKATFISVKSHLVEELAATSRKLEVQTKEVARVTALLLHNLEQKMTSSSETTKQTDMEISEARQNLTQATTSESGDGSGQLQKRKGDGSEDSRKYKKRTHYPVVKDETPDNEATDPDVRSLVFKKSVVRQVNNHGSVLVTFQFSTHPDNLIDHKIIQRLHEAATDEVSRDQFFVSEMLSKVFGDSTLENHTIGGTIQMNENTGIPEVVRILDKAKLDYIFDILRIRVKAVGVNSADRKARSQRNYFNDYVRMTAEKHRKRMLRRQKGQGNEGD
jgi:hypothetical protein